MYVCMCVSRVCGSPGHTHHTHTRARTQLNPSTFGALVACRMIDVTYTHTYTHARAQLNPSTFGALVACRMIDATDDGVRAVGLRLLTAFMARASFQRKDDSKVYMHTNSCARTRLHTCTPVLQK